MCPGKTEKGPGFTPRPNRGQCDQVLRPGVDAKYEDQNGNEYGIGEDSDKGWGRG